MFRFKITFTEKMAESKTWKKHVVIQGRPYFIGGKVENVKRKPADKKDGDHRDEEPAGPKSQHPDHYHFHL